MLKDDFQYYLDHQNELVQKYNGKVLAIKDQQVIGIYDSEFEALSKTSEKHEPGTFIIQKCTPGDSSYSATYHSRYSFV